VGSTSPVPPEDASSNSVPHVPPHSPFRWGVVVFFMLLGFVLSIEKALLWSGGAWNAEVSGYAFAGIVIPLLISYAIAGRRKNRKLVLFSVIFAAIASVGFAMELADRPKDPNAKVADLVREAAGAKPVGSSQTSESPQDKLLRQVLSELFENLKTYREKTHELDGDLRNVYSPESFSSSEAMSRTSDSVQKITSLDHEFFLELEQWPLHVQQQTAQSSLSQSDKQTFLKGFDESFSNSEIVTLRRQGDQIEQKWCSDTVALYDFGRSHVRQIRVKDTQLLIDDSSVRTPFNELLRESREQQQKMRDTNSQMAKLQQVGLQKLGLTIEDLGAESSDSKAK
jgi:hypothetical protein